ncbi:MAG: hypothetical protein K1X55_09205 [Chitinophagales bacterium]|nr:hypothetical protein [Chitinophagales bacterium]
MKNYLLFIFVYCFILKGFTQVAEPPLTSPNIEHIIQHPALAMLGKTVEAYLPDLQKIGLFSTSPNENAVQKGNANFQIKSNLDYYEKIKWNTPIYAVSWNYVNTTDPNSFFPLKKEFPEIEMPDNLLFGSTDKEVYNLYGESHQQTYSDASPLQYKRWIYTIPGDSRSGNMPITITFDFFASGSDAFRLSRLSVAFTPSLSDDSVATAPPVNLNMSEFNMKRAITPVLSAYKSTVLSESFWKPGENQLRVLEISLKPGEIATVLVAVKNGGEKEVQIYSTNLDEPEKTRFYENEVIPANEGYQVIKAITRNVSNVERIQQLEVHSNGYTDDTYYILLKE